MKKFEDPEKLRSWARKARLAGRKIALVPTMGALHAGHLSLIAAAKRKGADEIAVSVFVNPTQFGPKEDYAKYPRDHAADAKKCAAAGATAIFFPTPENMYASDHSVWVVEDGALSGSLCGARRPGHFRGVCTVVAKLFNLVQPDFAVFGQKDFQQAAIVRRMARDLSFGVEIVVAPIVREESGLALSSRNAYLSAEEKTRALALSATLKELKAGVAAKGALPWKAARARAAAALERAGLAVDYVEAVDAADLTPVKTLRKGNAVLLAAFAGKTRLIDNCVV
ncbi:MAG: pantoate--beta-alanine ligase [Kiritimatiellae bacterium]|nr:pantoate--beta-alanine ligase [Kiritimatiellia bacterium]